MLYLFSFRHYVGNFLFPNIDAGSHRVYWIGKALRESGYETVFLGAERTGRPQDFASGGGYIYDNFLHYPAGNSGSSPLRRALRLWSTYLSGLSTMSRLKAIWTEDYVAVFAYQASSLLLAQLRRFCDQHNAVLVADVVEWYDRNHITMGRFGPLALDSELRMRYMNCQTDGVVAISSYLQHYYGREGKPTVRVPTLVDIRANLWNRSSIKQGANSPLSPASFIVNPYNNQLILAYTGIPGKKDLLNNVIEALLQIDPEGHQVHLAVAGPKAEELLRFPALKRLKYKSLPGCVRALGHLPHEDALNIVREADFTVLLRPSLRYAQAGFPTKVPESLSVGTPVICNITSDLGDYINDGKEGLICRDESVAAFMEALKRAILLKPDQKESMRRAARSQAERSFDYRNYAESLDRFIQESCWK